MNKKANLLLWASGIITVIISVIMNIFLIPAIESTTEGIRCFDMNPFGYSYETAVRFLALLSQEGRNIYLHIQLPLDFVYPIFYTAFFILLFVRLHSKIKALFAVPALLMISDYAENIMSVVMLKSEVLSAQLAATASTATVIKSLLMYVCFILVIILFVKYLIKEKKQKNDKTC